MYRRVAQLCAAQAVPAFSISCWFVASFALGKITNRGSSQPLFVTFNFRKCRRPVQETNVRDYRESSHGRPHTKKASTVEQRHDNKIRDERPDDIGQDGKTSVADIVADQSGCR